MKYTFETLVILSENIYAATMDIPGIRHIKSTSCNGYANDSIMR